MIDDLDRTLEALLRRDLPAGIAEQISISFLTPDEEFPPAEVSVPAVDLFLYDVRENKQLRDTQWVAEYRNGTAVRKRPPVRIDCSYLITAWASRGSSTRAFDEHRLLSEVMRVLLRYPLLPDALLAGALRGQDPSLPTATLQPGQLQSVAEFWQALGGKPKAALNYSVTIGIEPMLEEEAGALVLEKEIRFAFPKGD